jgi:phytol kinase
MYPDDPALILAFSALFFGVFGLIEWAKRRFDLSPEYTRRVAHIVSGLLTILNYTFLSPIAFVAMVVAGGVAIVLTRMLKIGTAVHDVERRTYGDALLAFGYLSAYALSFPDGGVFITAVLIITFADAFAGLTGNLLKSTSKTRAGSAVFFVTTLVILQITCELPVAPAIGVALILTGIERVSPLGLDNVTVPIATSLLLLSF